MSTTQDRFIVGPENAGALMTPEEFDSVVDWDDLYVYQLISGVLVVTPPPSAGERAPNELLGRLLWAYKEQNAGGNALDYTLPEHVVRVRGNRRRADRVIWSGLGRFPDVDRDPPSIAVEFVSAGRRNRERDYEVKREEYLEAGVAEYWIVDRFRRELTVHRGPLDRATEHVVREGEVYTTPLLPGFELPVERLVQEADRIREAKERPRDH